MSSPLKPSALIGNAIKRFEKVGWTQGKMKEYKDGKVVGYCAIGGLGLQAAYLSLAEDFVMSATKKLGFKKYSSVMNWNDTNGRTKEQVLKVFRLAKQMAEEDDK